MVRRTVSALVQAGALLGVVALVTIAGCERPPESVEDQEIATPTMTEDEFVDHVAALTVAVEEGLTGEEARNRAAELGGGHYSREEIEAFAELLRADPVKWAGLADRVDRRIEKIRGEGEGGGERVGRTGESRSAEDEGAREASGEAP